MTTATATAVHCPDCGEAVTFHRRYRTWLHDRTESNVCAPLCTVEGCQQPAVVKTGYHGFDGSGSRFIRTGFRCSAHREPGAIQWT